MILIIAIVLISLALFGLYRLFSISEHSISNGKIISMHHFSDAGETSTKMKIEYKLGKEIKCLEENIGSTSFLWSMGDMVKLKIEKSDIDNIVIQDMRAHPFLLIQLIIGLSFLVYYCLEKI